MKLTLGLYNLLRVTANQTTEEQQPIRAQEKQPIRTQEKPTCKGFYYSSSAIKRIMQPRL